MGLSKVCIACASMRKREGVEGKIKAKDVEMSRRKKRTRWCHASFLSTENVVSTIFQIEFKKLPVFLYDFLMASTIL